MMSKQTNVVQKLSWSCKQILHTHKSVTLNDTPRRKLASKPVEIIALFARLSTSRSIVKLDLEELPTPSDKRLTELLLLLLASIPDKKLLTKSITLEALCNDR
jgi:hypothetical protein